MKKYIGYRFFAWIYRVCCLLWREDGKKYVLWNGHSRGLSGNLREIYRRLRQEEPDARFVILSKRELFFDAAKGRPKWLPGLVKDTVLFFIVLPYHMATAGRVFLNDNFLPLCYMPAEKRKTQFIQLWHGAGAFKRFGLSTEEDQRVAETVRRANQKLTHLFVTSSRMVPLYAEAFGIAPDRIYVTGLPVTDLYFDEARKKKKRSAFYRKYPGLAGRKLLLYTPTFRRTSRENQQILEHFDPERVWKALGEEWVILIKLHPKFPLKDISQNDHCLDMTYYNDISDLFLVSDLLVTDYSSTVVEYVLLDKPVIFYAYDLADYDRGFYFDYEEMMPGRVAHDEDEFLELLKKSWRNMEKQQNFVNFEYDNIRGGSCDRILKILQS